MKTLSAFTVIATIAGLLAAASPAAAADLPPTRPGQAPLYVPPPRVMFVPGCHLGLERFWDGYAWRSRSIQICN